MITITIKQLLTTMMIVYIMIRHISGSYRTRYYRNIDTIITINDGIDR